MDETRQRVLLAVNGTLMRGLELTKNLIAVNATFCYEAQTERSYRLWSVEDRHPAMLRVDASDTRAAEIALEVWSVPAEGIAAVLLSEPPGLCIGKVRLRNGQTVLGVLGEPALVQGMREITKYGGWRSYLAAINKGKQEAIK